MSESEDENQNGLSGFLFGNLDENNRLDADYLDAVREKCCLLLSGSQPI